MRRSLAAKSPEGGFTLVGVVVAMAIIVILVAAVGPSIAMILERDRQTELIFRGKQYARAIAAFQKRYGRLPNELKEMSKMKPRTIRQLWKDPMCNCDDWQVIFAGSPEAAPMGNAPPPQNNGLQTQTPGFRTRTPSGGSGLSSGFGSGFGFDETPTPGPFGSGSGPNLTPTPSSIFGQETKKTGPIVGVRTKVHRAAIVPWRGRNFTDEWRFLAGDADNDQQQGVGPNPGVLTPAAPSR
ncbi:MAG TPA: type II secretion system protein [Thermoanaerobaculia bacterium]|nr:type II secretion system protein [Thermoanaerobaculia bacterium]